RVTLTLIDGPARIDDITGRDADLVPRDPSKNAASIAAVAWLRAHGDLRNPAMTIEKGLPLAGGMGGSAASSVAGAYAAALATGAENPPSDEIIAAALQGEVAVAGHHLDNIAASALGGLTISRSVQPVDVVAVRVAAPWFVATVTPAVRIETKAAREILPRESDRATWVQQMANTAALAHAFAVGDAELVRRALDDRYAEPRRAALIPQFHEMKRAALLAGALGCSISGSGPTTFAIAIDEPSARRCAEAMQHALTEVASTSHVGAIAKRGARAV
ncbi:MAG: homoserine kinase, partial [Thermoanaerobaculia bacterium]